MKVRAKQYGQYKGRLYEPGQEFIIEDGTYEVHSLDAMGNILMENGKPKVISTRSHLEHWMEKVADSTSKKGYFQ